MLIPNGMIYGPTGDLSCFHTEWVGLGLELSALGRKIYILVCSVQLQEQIHKIECPPCIVTFPKHVPVDVLRSTNNNGDQLQSNVFP